MCCSVFVDDGRGVIAEPVAPHKSSSRIAASQEVGAVQQTLRKSSCLSDLEIVVYVV